MPSLSVFAAVLALGGHSMASVARPRHAVDHSYMHATNKRENLVPLQYARADTTGGSGVVTLKPVRPGDHAKKHRRDTTGSPFDLIPEDALYWAGEDGTIAELIMDMPGEDEAIVNMEYFDDLIESVSCPEGATDITIDFQDQTNLDAAGEIWAWVNENDARRFYLMVGAGDCGWNVDRFLFQVNTMDVTADTKIVTLTGESQAWQEALHSYGLNVGRPAMGGTVSEESLSKRGFLDDIGDFFGGEFNPDLSIPFENDLTGKSLTFNLQPGTTFLGKCVDCKTTGTLDIEAKFRVKLFDIEEAFVEVSTGGLSATAVLDLTLSGDLTDSLFNQSLPLFKFSPAGIAIPGIVTIGPTVGVALTAGISAIKGAITLTVGGTATIPQSRWKLDFLDEAGNAAEGLQPTIEPIPLEAEASIEVKATASFDATVGLELSVLETGFAAELQAKLLTLTAALKAVTSLTCSACDKFANAIEGSVTIGSSLVAAVKKKAGSTFTDLFSFPILATNIPPLASFCEPVGPQDLCTPNATWVGFRH